MTATAAPGRLRELDWLMVTVIGLSAIGLVMAVSVSGPLPDSGALRALQVQGTKLAVGIVAFLAAAMVPLPWLRRAATPLFVVAIALCVIALLFPDSKGASRWIRFGAMSFQPVELARFSLILFIAAWVAEIGPRIRGFVSGFVAVMGPAALLCFVLVLQPDVGNAVFALTIAAVMAVVGGVQLRHFLWASVPVAGPLLLLILSRRHVQDRLTGFLDIERGSQVWQSLVAISSGGVLGRGLGDGWMKMGFVAEARNDFVFAMIGEELGLAGSLLVVALYSSLGFVGLRLVLRVQDPFHRLAVFGFSFAICMQAAINLLVVTGLAPAKGIDLPFISSGGTNLVFSLAAIGLIGNAVRTDAGNLK